MAQLDLLIMFLGRAFILQTAVYSGSKKPRVEKFGGLPLSGGLVTVIATVILTAILLVIAIVILVVVIVTAIVIVIPPLKNQSPLGSSPLDFRTLAT